MASPDKGATGDARARTADLFIPVNAGRISATIVEQIRAVMRQGHLRPGDRLPSERELCNRFGVSRVTVRDALRILESAGLVEVRVGARGGAFVTAPTASKVGEGLSDMLTMSSLLPDDVTEARIVVELGILDLVCARADETDLAELSEICERSQDALAAGTYTMDMSTEFHVRVAHSAHNHAFDLLVESFREALRMSLFAAQAVAPIMGDPGVKEHMALVDAIRRREPVEARAVMEAHLRRTADRLARPVPASRAGAKQRQRRR